MPPDLGLPGLNITDPNPKGKPHSKHSYSNKRLRHPQQIVHSRYIYEVASSSNNPIQTHSYIGRGIMLQI